MRSNERADRSSARRPLGVLVTSALVAAAALGTASPALADDGPAPDPVEYQVLEKVHTDAVSTFLDEGTFTLGTRADLPEGNGTRLDPAETLFHVDDASRQSVPAGYEFVAPAGGSVWIAPESNPAGGDGYTQLWPGFSTESVPVGAVDGNSTKFRLVSMDGPVGGDLEVWRGSGSGLTRMWSSDEGIDSFAVGRTHMHANWAFTKAGTYRLTVEGAAAIGGEPVTGTAVYTFVVGGLPEIVGTTTTLEASATEVVEGSPVTFSAAVAPAGVEGHVELRDGSAVLGHSEVSDSGAAELEVSGLGVGTRSITAVFVPSVANFTTGSTSDPVAVTVVDGSGMEFGVVGVADAYEPGDTLTATAVGATLKENQVFRWLLRTQGYSSTVVAQSGAGATYSRELDALADGIEISVAVYDSATRTTLAESPWVPIAVVGQGAQPVITATEGFHDPLLPGDVIEFTVSGRELAEGESITWGFVPYGGYFGAIIPEYEWDATYTDDARTTVRLRSKVNAPETRPYSGPLTASVVKDGVTIARSDFHTITTGHRELNVTGHRNLYREGGTVTMDASVYPVREGDELAYTWNFTKGDVSEVWGAEQQATAALTGPELSLAEHDGGTLRLDVYSDGLLAQQSPSYPVNVTADLTSQILEIGTLAGHYHQGDALDLTLTVDPEPLDGDVLEWQWKWPGSEDWKAMTGVEDNVFATAAEQALDGVEIRAVLTYADPETASAVTETRTVHVDDHGAPARQQVAVVGEAAYQEGETVTLSAEVTPGTVLTAYQWERKAAPADEFSVVEGESGATLTFTAAAGDHGTEYRVTAMTPSGLVGYGPSPATALTVTEADDEPGTDEPGTDEPGTDEPGTDEPGTDEPGTDEPGTDEPGTDEPGTDEPDTDEPGTDEPGTDQPGTDEPGTDEPGTDQPGTDEPGTDQPGGEESEPSVPRGRPTDEQGSPSPEGVLAATGSAGVPLLVGGALLLTLGGALLIAVRGRAQRRAA
ncbi:choice-of-anchor M domain-containing protein [Promicromonospora umidemergens]|uniref:choice-of-anchor M domain-containing protein n=1 Tax=Promicromonospora umidemergens TaxID=629679 RepID=UPI0020A3165A|nr:choice-of-anchor M domain-containing protein [Promicromonospora umidemergens]